jgi:hypothetical protein
MSTRVPVTEHGEHGGELDRVELFVLLEPFGEVVQVIVAAHDLA